MKIFILNSLVIAIAFASALSASAQNIPTAPINTKPVPVRATVETRNQTQDLKAKVASTSPQIRENLASSTEARLNKMKEELSRKFKKMLDRIQATIERQEKILARINSRIEKIKLGGGNTVEAEKFISEAKVNIDKAKVSLETLKTTTTGGIQNIASTTGAVKKETMTKMREENKNIEKSLKETHRLLERALGSLRGLSQIRNATSTNATTTAN